jgi:multidrug transporter EmrE-like cation transporter
VIKNLLLIFIYLIFVSLANLLLRSGMKILNSKQIDFEFFFHAFTNIKIIIGLIFFIISMIIWLVVLSRMELTFAHPLLSLSVVLIALSSWIYFGETFNIYRLVGIILTMLGSWFIIKS